MILAALCSIELYDKPEKMSWLQAPVILMHTQPNGRCFWASLFLAMGASPHERFLWNLRNRTKAGFPLNRAEAIAENEVVLKFALGLNQGKIPEATKTRIQHSVCIEPEDLEASF